MSFGASSVSVLDYNPSMDYYVTLNVTAPDNWYRATLTFGKRRVIQLGLKRQSSFRVLPDSRVFTQFRPGVEGLVVLTLTINNPKNVRSRIWGGASSNSGMAGVATERSWIKWVGGNDTEINAITNKFYTAIHLSAGFGDKPLLTSSLSVYAVHKNARILSHSYLSVQPSIQPSSHPQRYSFSCLSPTIVFMRHAVPTCHNVTSHSPVQNGGGQGIHLTYSPLSPRYDDGLVDVSVPGHCGLEDHAGSSCPSRHQA